MVERPLVDGQPRIAGHGDRPEHLAGRRFDVERVEVDPRPHDVADRPFAEAKRLGRHRLLHGLENALCAARLEKVFDVIHRHGWPILLVGAQHDQHRRRGGAHQPHEWPSDLREDLHGRGDQTGEVLGAAQRQSLGNQFAEQERDERQQHHEYRQGDRSGHGTHGRRGVDRDPFGEVAHQAVTAIGCCQRAHERDPDLNGGKKLVRARSQLERRLRCLVARVGQLAEASAAAGDDRHLCPREEAVGEDQGEDKEDFRQHAWIRSGRRITLGWQRRCQGPSRRG